MLLDDPEENDWGKERIVKWTELYFPAWRYTSMFADDVSRFYYLTMITKCPKITSQVTMMTTIVNIQTAMTIKNVNYMIIILLYAFLFIFVEF